MSTWITCQATVATITSPCYIGARAPTCLAAYWHDIATFMLSVGDVHLKHGSERVCRTYPTSCATCRAIPLATPFQWDRCQSVKQDRARPHKASPHMNPYVNMHMPSPTFRICEGVNMGFEIRRESDYCWPPVWTHIFPHTWMRPYSKYVMAHTYWLVIIMSAYVDISTWVLKLGVHVCVSSGMNPHSSAYATVPCWCFKCFALVLLRIVPHKRRYTGWFFEVGRVNEAGWPPDASTQLHIFGDMYLYFGVSGTRVVG